LAIGSKVDVRVNLDRENIDHLKEFIEFIAAKGWSSNENFYCDIAPVSDHHSKGSLPNLMPENEILRRIGELFPGYWDNEKFLRLLLFRVLHHINNVVDVSAVQDNSNQGMTPPKTGILDGSFARSGMRLPSLFAFLLSNS
jgi:sulfatase maturation enzyme AslB (radical SAM superfamily)